MELAKLKALLGIEDDSKDVILEFVIDDVEETIKNYCHVDTVPDGLMNTGYRMAMDLYRNENIGSCTGATGSVSSITEGDTSTSFRQYVDDNFKDTVLKNYKSSLNRYRKVAW
nr:MAG TPA: Head Tail Connector Protein [Caudoviricetes sp.]